MNQSSHVTTSNLLPTVTFATPHEFAERLIAWQKQFGRHFLPWQNTRDAYRIWLSEIMLQQTQVATVIPYYARFLDRFPDVQTLAAAHADEVLALWAGLGYYTRARNLHACAKAVVERHGGIFPVEQSALADLPGIGRSTAAAITAFANGTRAAILDGNVKRVLTRVFGISGFPGEKKIENQLWALAESLLPQADVAGYIQRLMDMGATVCTRSRPLCHACPVAAQCAALQLDMVGNLPTRKPRKAVPVRRAVLWMLTHEGQILLERRPPAGIWGGLWSLPENALAEDFTVADISSELHESSEFDTLATQRFSDLGKVEQLTVLPALTHVFTHFRLEITPVWLTFRPLFQTLVLSDAAADSSRWWPISELDEVGVPTPVRKLFELLKTHLVVS